MNDVISFESLLGNVLQVHEITSTYAKGAVNQLLTVRNWMIGYYIVEFEQRGQNKAAYGTHLLEDLAERIDVKGLDRQLLNTCRLFYLRYPQICETVSRKLQGVGYNLSLPVLNPKRSENEICETASRKFETAPYILRRRLSFEKIKDILVMDDHFESFYNEF